jgi:hypothetical protein
MGGNVLLGRRCTIGGDYHHYGFRAFFGNDGRYVIRDSYGEFSRLDHDKINGLVKSTNIWKPQIIYWTIVTGFKEYGHTQYIRHTIGRERELWENECKSVTFEEFYSMMQYDPCYDEAAVLLLGALKLSETLSAGNKEAVE